MQWHRCVTAFGICAPLRVQNLLGLLVFVCVSLCFSLLWFVAYYDEDDEDDDDR